MASTPIAVKKELEEKWEELIQISKYKDEFSSSKVVSIIKEVAVAVHSSRLLHTFSI